MAFPLRVVLACSAVAVVASAVLPAPSSRGAAAAGPSLEGPVAGVVVQAESVPAAAAAVRAVGGSISAELEIVSGVAATVPARTLSALARTPGVRAVTPNERVRVSGGLAPHPRKSRSRSSRRPSARTGCGAKA